MWEKSPYDGGHTPQHNIVVEIEDLHQPEWRHQYRIKKDVEEGIKTKTGLLNASVLEKTTLEWNTHDPTSKEGLPITGEWYTI